MRKKKNDNSGLGTVALYTGAGVLGLYLVTRLLKPSTSVITSSTGNPTGNTGSNNGTDLGGAVDGVIDIFSDLFQKRLKIETIDCNLRSIVFSFKGKKVNITQTQVVIAQGINGPVEIPAAPGVTAFATPNELTLYDVEKNKTVIADFINCKIR